MRYGNELAKKLKVLRETLERGETVVLAQHLKYRGQAGQLLIRKRDGRYVMYHNVYSAGTQKVIATATNLYDAYLMSRKIMAHRM